MRRNDWNRLTRALSESDADRDALAANINAANTSGPELDEKCVRALLEKEHGQVWNSWELGRDFEVEAFASPLVVVTRRCDGCKGTLVFQHCPRFYWGFESA